MSLTADQSSETHAPGTVSRLATQQVDDLNGKVSDVYAETAARHFKDASESELLPRIRSYDNYQRITFGRAQSRIISCREIRSLTLPDLDRIQYEGGPDQSYFPSDTANAMYEPLTEMLQETAAILLGEGTHDDETAMVSLFCHRVIVRPQEEYKGFFHRDLAPRGGRIGTIIWYPQIRHELVQGLDFIAYAALQDQPLGLLRLKVPDYKFAPSQYHRAALVLGYPNNFAHGVLAGVNNLPRERGKEFSIADFASPAQDCFVKDLVIITISESSPVEQ